MQGVRLDQVQIHDENKCLLHNSVSLIGNVRCRASDMIKLKNIIKSHPGISRYIQI
jgi:hypothetical protein